MTDHQPDSPSSEDLLPAKVDPATPKWLTLSEAAGFLGIHFSTLRTWADKGEIRVFRTPGGHRRFSSADLRRFLEERATSTELVSVDGMMEAALGKGTVRNGQNARRSFRMAGHVDRAGSTK